MNECFSSVNDLSIGSYARNSDAMQKRDVCFSNTQLQQQLQHERNPMEEAHVIQVQNGYTTQYIET